MNALDEAEMRIGCALPAGFRKTYTTRPVLTGIERFTISLPEGIRRTTYEDEDETPIDAVVVGSDFGGHALLLVFREGTLGEALYIRDHETRELEKVADRLEDLLPPPRSERPEPPPEETISEEPAVDPAVVRARALVRLMIERGGLELSTPRSRESVIEITARILERDRESVGHDVLEAWIRADEVAEVFVDEVAIVAAFEGIKRSESAP